MNYALPLLTGHFSEVDRVKSLLQVRFNVPPQLATVAVRCINILDWFTIFWKMQQGLMKSVSRGNKLAVARPAQFVECWNQVCEVMGLYTGETTNRLLFFIIVKIILSCLWKAWFSLDDHNPLPDLVRNLCSENFWKTPMLLANQDGAILPSYKYNNDIMCTW